MARKTRKLRRDPELGPAECHPKLRTANGNCLPREELTQVAGALGAPRTLKGRRLKHWMRRRTRCRSERCWVEKAPMDDRRKKELTHKFFRPARPAGWKYKPNDWLDTLNIEEVLKQYEELYPNFKFYGAVPIDFSAPDPYNKSETKCMEKQICDIDLKQLKAQGITKLGFVYNLDPHFKQGSHWVASFTDIPAHKSYYFDSYGYPVPSQVARFMRSLTVQDPNMKLEYCARRFQFSESECGMYCIYFILQMIKGVNFKQFCRSGVKDSDMLKLRKWVFAPKDE